MVSDLNENDQWWSWLRSGPWHCIELNLEKASPPQANASKSGTVEGDPRIKGVRHTNIDSVLKIRVNLIESTIIRLNRGDIRKHARLDLQAVLAGCGERHNFTAPVPQLRGGLEPAEQG